MMIVLCNVCKSPMTMKRSEQADGYVESYRCPYAYEHGRHLNIPKKHWGRSIQRREMYRKRAAQ